MEDEQHMVSCPRRPLKLGPEIQSPRADRALLENGRSDPERFVRWTTIAENGLHGILQGMYALTVEL